RIVPIDAILDGWEEPDLSPYLIEQLLHLPVRLRMIDPSDDVSDMILHQVGLELGQSSLLDIRMGGVELNSMIREYALRLTIPRSRILEHLDSVLRGCL